MNYQYAIILALCVGTIKMSNGDATSPLVPPTATSTSGKLVELQVINDNLRTSN